MLSCSLQPHHLNSYICQRHAGTDCPSSGKQWVILLITAPPPQQQRLSAPSGCGLPLERHKRLRCSFHSPSLYNGICPLLEGIDCHSGCTKDSSSQYRPTTSRVAFVCSQRVRTPPRTMQKVILPITALPPPQQWHKGLPSSALILTRISFVGRQHSAMQSVFRRHGPILVFSESLRNHSVRCNQWLECTARYAMKF